MRTIGWLKRVSLGVLALGIVALVAGVAIEQQARVRVRSMEIPGKLVTINDGRRIQLDCRGSGSPTVVLESGLDVYGSLSWVAVHDSIAQFSRVCAYSRAGIMWSDQAQGPFSSENNARDLHEALASGGEVGPWVMVGHSIGAAYVTTFTQLFDAEVEGLVFVDGSHPDQFAKFMEVTGKSLVPSSSEARIGAALAWTGLLRVLQIDLPPASWPAATRQSNSFLPTSIGSLVSETERVPETLVRAGAMRSFGDRPLRVLSATIGADQSQLQAMGLTTEQGERVHVVSMQLHDDEASWSRCGRHDVVQHASHYIQFDRPDAVIAAVHEVVDAVRSIRKTN